MSNRSSNGRSFDIADAIFWFFKCFGARPLGAMWIALWQALVGGFLAALIFYLILPAFADLGATVIELDDGSISEEEGGLIILGAVFRLLAAGSWGMILGVLAALSFQGAWLRFLTRGEIAPVIPLRLGSDELRLFGVNLLYIGVGMAMYFGVVMVLLTLGVTGGGIIAASGENSVSGAVGFGLTMFLGVIAIAVSVIFIAVKLSCAPALSVHDRKFRFFESWEATNSVFGHMVLSYLVVGMLILVLALVVGTMIELIFLGALLPLLGEIMVLVEHGAQPTVDELIEIVRGRLMHAEALVPVAIGLVLSYILQIVYEGMWHGVAAYNAVRYRDGSTQDEGDAPVLGEDSPLGASPREG
ncbi:MAG: hypothetical protein GYB36_07605 [Alphaproteobacteria bacterium]|nr:hypothetical protein [Alphaproteobacteria bacterium]